MPLVVRRKTEEAMQSIRDEEVEDNLKHLHNNVEYKRRENM